MGREIFKGQHIVGGQTHDRSSVERAGEVAGGLDGLMEGFGGLVIGNQDESGGGLRERLKEEWEVKGAGCKGESGDATARSSRGTARLQVASNAVEGVAGFEVGEQVADEGQDHAGFSLSGTKLSCSVSECFMLTESSCAPIRNKSGWCDAEES